MPESIFIQFILFGLAFLSIGWNLFVLLYAFHYRPLKLRLLEMADERDMMLVRIVRTSARSGFYMVLTTLLGTILITVFGFLRNEFTLPRVYTEVVPAWFPLAIVGTYVGFYVLIFVPAYFYYRLVHSLVRLNATQEQREELRDGARNNTRSSSA